ncbi:DUF6282 family protein [Chelativorans sp. AA-79]|uniref:DUF6282 family protein n=1 Tax=Chelativorans sp. AA-79 TaxID=3028735 RepID=UPI0023F79072|nr:DUF6282 family protein [Chelativorans sp. AA-79]WEX08087.1 DUF6282 family protein [Chelativorans sp. AA-79]
MAVQQRARDIRAETVDALLKGAVDLHCHSGPSVMERKLDHMEEIRDAEEAGFHAVLFKDHFYSNTPVMRVLERFRDEKRRLTLLSGVPLNNQLGGLNPFAVEHGLMLGARMVWMPTLCAHNHLTTAFRYDLHGRLGLREPTRLSVLDAKGRLLPEVRDILDLIAAHDAVLCGGHLHVSEMFPLFAEAKARGVARMLVSHPTYWIEARIDDLKELSEMGVYLEHCACMLIEGPSRKFPFEQLRAYVDAAGLEHTIIGSDLGQTFNPRPVPGFRAAIELCLDLGFTFEEIRTMTSTNACRLIGIDPPAGLHP